MPAFVPERLHDDPREPVIVDSSALPWTRSPQPGVERRFLERRGGEVARATSIVRYAAASSFTPHAHDEGEEFLVLEGTFSDEHGDFAAGTYVRNPPGSAHAPFTRAGCVIFVKLRQMCAAERERLVVCTKDVAAEPTGRAGITRIPLHRDAREDVGLEIFEPGASWRERRDLGGEELLVLVGRLVYGGEEHGAGTWLRFPAGRERPLASASGCRLWTKRGHVRAGI